MRIRIIRRIKPIAAGSLLLIALFLAACNGEKPTDPGDTTAPTVLSTMPDSGAVDVSVDANMVITFSEPILASTLSSSSITTSPAIAGQFSTGGNNVTLTPSAPLDYSTEYTVTITTSVTDPAGNRLATENVFNFETEIDPETLPPTVTSTDPSDDATGVSVSSPIAATFSKDIDPLTINSSTFTISHGVTGTVSYSNRVATFTPDSPLPYLVTFTCVISQDVTDTSGTPVTEPHFWRFTSEPDPFSPSLSITDPFYDAIVGSTVVISATVDEAFVAVDSVLFYAFGQRVGVDNSEPYQYTWDASSVPLGEIVDLVAEVYDADGRVGLSDSVKVHYLWELIALDPQEPELPEQDVSRMLVRYTDSLLEMRFEYRVDWDSVPVNDPVRGPDLGISFDTDLNLTSGGTSVTADDDSQVLIGIGAEYRIVIGLHGANALSQWVLGGWSPVYGPEGLAYLNLPPDARFFEYGITWSDLGLPDAVFVVGTNVSFFTESDWDFDFVPDKGSGFVTIVRENRYIGDPVIPAAISSARRPAQPSHVLPDPFQSR